MLKRLLGEKIAKMFRSGVEDVQFMCYIIITFGLHRAFIDKFHAAGHTITICNDISGVLNFRNIKFKHVYKGTNDNVCEQYWVKHNRLRSMKAYGTDRFDFTLILKKELHNDDRKRSLEKEGWTWEPVTNWSKLRSISAEEFKIWIDNIRSKQYEPWKPSWDEYTTEKVNEYTISSIKRIAFKYDFTESYCNIWDRRSDEWKIDRDLQKLLKFVHVTTIKPLFYQSKFHKMRLQELVKYTIVKHFSIAKYSNYEDVIKEYCDVVQKTYNEYIRLYTSYKYKQDQIPKLRAYIDDMV